MQRGGRPLPGLEGGALAAAAAAASRRASPRMRSGASRRARRRRTRPRSAAHVSASTGRSTTAAGCRGRGFERASRPSIRRHHGPAASSVEGGSAQGQYDTVTGHPPTTTARRRPRAHARHRHLVRCRGPCARSPAPTKSRYGFTRAERGESARQVHRLRGSRARVAPPGCAAPITPAPHPPRERHAALAATACQSASPRRARAPSAARHARRCQDALVGG